VVLLVVWWWWWSWWCGGGGVDVVVVVVADIYLVYLSLLLSLTCNLFFFVQHQSGAALNHLGGSSGSHVGPSQPGPSP
jgi:hypothetical protein